MNKRIQKSLSAQLFCCVLISLAASVAAFFLTYFSLTLIIEHTTLSTDLITDRLGESLQEYVEEHEINSDSLREVSGWCHLNRKVYLALYDPGGTPVFQSEDPALRFTIAENGDGKLSLEWELPDQQRPLTLADGTVLKAFFYFETSSPILSLAAACASLLLSFVVFALGFFFLVRGKIAYIELLHKELDILAGGQLNYSVSVRGHDELGDLAFGIEQMRRSILASREAEDKIRSANSQLVTAMSHDLRTPLTSLMAYLEILDRGKYQDEAQRSVLIHKSLEQSMRIKAMADQLFEYFLVYDTQWEKPDMELIRAEDFFPQLWSEYGFALESNGYTVKTDFAPLDGHLWANPAFLHRAFDNLYSNLLKYADPASPVEISFSRQGQTLHLNLRNQALPKADQPQSTGIGLATCRRILEIHSGSLRTGQECGIFSIEITLPLSD